MIVAPRAQMRRDRAGALRTSSTVFMALAALSCVHSAARGRGTSPDLDETLAPYRVHVAVATPLAGATEVVGLLRVPAAGADTVIVCVHGSGGSKENWGPIPARGYSSRTG